MRKAEKKVDEPATGAQRRTDYTRLEGVIRPGALECHIEGISTKVLSERLRKLHAYGLLTKLSYAEVPPRTEYQLTDAGRKLAAIIEQIHQLDRMLPA
jgi:DNA-binding HxlR family transcriptional regulator